MPGGVWMRAFSTRIRPICSARSSSPSASIPPFVSTSSSCSVDLGDGMELVRERSRQHVQVDGLRLDVQPAGVEAGQVEQLGCELGQPVDLLPHRRHELLLGTRLELLVLHQLQEAAEGEERRSQLVRGVGDELAAGVLQLGQPLTHSLERIRQLADLVGPLVGNGLREVAAGEPVGRALEPMQAACEDGRRCVADGQRDEQRDHPREEDPTAHAVDVRQRIVERGAEEDDERAATDGRRGLGVPLALASNRARRTVRRLEGTHRDRVVLHVLRRHDVRVVEDVLVLRGSSELKTTTRAFAAAAAVCSRFVR